MNIEQLQEVKAVYDMLNNGMSNPIKINQVYRYINPIEGIEVPMRAKITAINRFMMLNYNDTYNDLKSKSKPIDVKVDNNAVTIPETNSMGTMDNKDSQSHTENTDLLEVDFLTSEDKTELKTGKGNLVVVKDKGRKNSNNSKKMK